jgi:HK97 family phage prohead protease
VSSRGTDFDRLHLARKLADIRAEEDPVGLRLIRGLAAPFNRPTSGLAFVETITPGAFTAAIARSDIRALFNHDPSNLLGRTANGTLRVWESDRGLEYEVELPDTALAHDLERLIARGDISGNSFAFTVAAGGDTYRTEGGRMHRTITEAAVLFDVGPVVYPAYTDTVVSVRSIRAARAAAKSSPAIAHDLDRRLRRLRLASLSGRRPVGVR